MSKSVSDHEIYPNNIITTISLSKLLKDIIDRILSEEIFPSRTELVRFCIYNSMDKIDLMIKDK